VKIETKEKIFLPLIILFAIGIRLFFMHYRRTFDLINLGILASVVINIIIIYKLALLITKNDKVSSLFPALILAAVPSLPDITIVNQIPALLLAISSIFVMLTIYTMLNLKMLRLGLFFPIIATILHPSAALLVPGFIGYFILSFLEHNKVGKKEITYAALSIIFIVLISFFSISISTLKLKIPVFQELRQVLGLIPMYVGFIGAYFGLKNKNRKSLLPLSVGGSALFLLFFKIVTVESLVPYIGLNFAALSCLMLVAVQELIKISKFKNHLNKILLYMFLVALISSLFLWV
jgi:hypothetical protein